MMLILFDSLPLHSPLALCRQPLHPHAASLALLLQPRTHNIYPSLHALKILDMLLGHLKLK